MSQPLPDIPYTYRGVVIVRTPEGYWSVPNTRGKPGNIVWQTLKAAQRDVDEQLDPG